MHPIGFLCLLAAVGLFLLEVVAPHHSLLDTVNEAVGALPFELPFSTPISLAALGSALLLISKLRSTRTRQRSSTPVPRPSPRPTTPKTEPPADGPEPTDDWQAEILEAIDSLELESGVSLHVDRSQGIPFTLIMERCTPGRVRRSLVGLGLFLSRLPRPPRVSILFNDCEKSTSPWQHMVTGALAPHIGRNTARMVSLTNRVDLIFADSDPCYTQTKED